jgi:cytoskeletal protein RodZ
MGFLAKYTEFLGANKEELLAEYRRERGGLATSRILSPQTAVSGKRIILTPKLLTIGAIILIFLGLFGYIFYSVRNFTSPPNLEISSPSTETVIRQETVEIIGKTDEGASLKINDQTVFIDNKGNFHETIKLQSGMNNIEVVATNRIRKETVKVVKILAEF